MLMAAEFALRKNHQSELTNTLSDWVNKLEKAREAKFYAKYLSKGEAHIAQAQPEHSHELLIELLSQDPPR
jgi:hypothetical protein